jgi:HAD superfamily hydrolase (TIGR01490 family)
MARPAAIVDLDGTLLAHGSAERFFLARALRAGMVTPLDLARGAARGLADWAAGRSGFYAAAKQYLHGLECAPLEALGVQCVHDEILPRLRPPILGAIEAHRAAGQVIVLLTGTLDFLGTEVARIVGADVAACCRLERHAGRFTGRIVPPYPHGTGKAEILLDLARREDLDLAASHAYANDASDALHLSCVGHAHVVAPDRRLRHIALARHWSVHEDAEGTRDSP